MESMKAKPFWYLEKPEEEGAVAGSKKAASCLFSAPAQPQPGGWSKWRSRAAMNASPRSAGAASRLSGFDSGVGKVRIAIKHSFFLKAQMWFYD